MNLENYNKNYLILNKAFTVTGGYVTGSYKKQVDR
jgi:hypothetical protein